jgi:ABC-type antimicrobial peptide transport system permease subunit
MNPFEPADAAGIYRPAALGQMDPVHMIVRVGAAPELFAPKVREISAAVDPTVRLYDLLPLEQVGRPEQLGYRAVAGVLVLLGAIALLLSSAGIHALMSFIVARRTREIGIRVALGGQRRTVIAAVFRRALIQLSAGALIGGGIAAIGTADELTRDGPALFLMVLAVMVLTGLVACAVPLARALRIQPTEALRES